MMKKKKPVLDERELQELYQIEHFGLWLMYGLLCAAILLQLLMGAEMIQMAGELAVFIVSSVAMVIANVRHGIWDMDARPSARGNAVCSVVTGACVFVVLAIVSSNVTASLAVGFGAAAVCFTVLTGLMHYMRKRQSRQEAELDNE